MPKPKVIIEEKAVEMEVVPGPGEEPLEYEVRDGFRQFRVAPEVTSIATFAGVFLVDEAGLIWLPNVTRSDLELIDRMMGVTIFNP
jgi:hypothetical protein